MEQNNDTLNKLNKVLNFVFKLQIKGTSSLIGYAPPLSEFVYDLLTEPVANLPHTYSKTFWKNLTVRRFVDHLFQISCVSKYITKTHLIGSRRRFRLFETLNNEFKDKAFIILPPQILKAIYELYVKINENAIEMIDNAINMTQLDRFNIFIRLNVQPGLCGPHDVEILNNIKETIRFNLDYRAPKFLKLIEKLNSNKKPFTEVGSLFNIATHELEYIPQSTSKISLINTLNKQKNKYAKAR